MPSDDATPYTWPDDETLRPAANEPDDTITKRGGRAPVTGMLTGPYHSPRTASGSNVGEATVMFSMAMRDPMLREVMVW